MYLPKYVMTQFIQVETGKLEVACRQPITVYTWTKLVPDGVKYITKAQ